VYLLLLRDQHRGTRSMASRIRRRQLTVSDQCKDMRQKYTEFVPHRSEAGMVWTGPIKPAPLSRIYVIDIVYRRRDYPQVWVRQPLLCVRIEDYKVVHIFSEGCLCLHAEDQWTPSMPISATIVPWAAEWLLYYELWLATGKWYGGGEYRVASRRSA